MLKEICEQPDAIAETIGERLYHGELAARRPEPERGADPRPAPGRVPGVRDVATTPASSAATCSRSGRGSRRRSTSPASGATATPSIDANTLVDRHRPVGRDDRHPGGRCSEARARGAHVLAITNVMGSQMTARVRLGALHPRRARDRRRRHEDVHRPARAAVPAGAAARRRSGARFEPDRADDAARGAARAARSRPGARSTRGALVEPIADRFAGNEFFLYLGRNIGLPIALEGALKLKEISYIPTDAYAAGEMKHGPIALLDETTPGGRDRHRRARLREGRLEHRGGARPRRPCDRGRDRGQRAHRRGGRARHLHARAPSPSCRRCWRCCRCSSSPTTIASRRGLDVDKPRNLAKTVTVE